MKVSMKTKIKLLSSLPLLLLFLTNIAFTSCENTIQNKSVEENQTEQIITSENPEA